MKTLAALLVRSLPPLVLATISAGAAPEPFALLHSLFDPGTNTQVYMQQGYSVAMNEKVVVVGAPDADAGAFDAGLVKIYDATTGVLLHTLNNPRALARDHFGNAVAISGTRVVVGAPSFDPTPNLFPPFSSPNAGVAYVYDLAGASPTAPALTLTNPNPASGDRYGAAVTISGPWVVVGVPHDSAGAPSSGSAYVFNLASAAPSVPVAKLTNPGPTRDAGFGFAVAISGARVAIGAYGAGPMDAGSAYVYDLAGAAPTVPVSTFNNPSPAAFDQFGVAVSLSGLRLVVGARYDDTAGENTGSVYVYDLGGDTPSVPVATLTNPSRTGNDNFGFAVGIEGTRVVVGAAGDSAGALAAGDVYLYELTGATPSVPVMTLTNPTPATADYFGFSVAIAGTRILAGVVNADLSGLDSGGAYLYDLAGATPAVPVLTLASPNLAGLELFGSSVAISGSRVVVGAIFDDSGANNAGRVHVYDLAGADPRVPVVSLSKPSPRPSDYFGSAVAISGSRVVVGSFLDDTGTGDAGSVYVYDLAGATPGVPVLKLNNPSPEYNDNFGSAASISGTRVVVGAPYDNTGARYAGSAYVYDLAGATPSLPVVTFTNPSPAASAFFGHSVAISGTRAVVGAPYDDTGATDAGVAYVYDLAGAAPFVPILALTNPSPAPEDHFGDAVAISGPRIVVGADGDDTGATNAGRAYVYDLTSVTPTVPVATLTNPSPAVSDFFGGSVAIAGTRVVVGVDKSDTGATDSGSAYVYDLADATPTLPVSRLTNPSPGSGDGFGHVVAIDGTTVVAGAPGDDTNAADRGAAYVFGLASALRLSSLRIAPSAPGLATISWTLSDFSGFVLQYTDSLAPAHWVTASSGAANPVTVSATNGMRFYRLVRP